MNSVVIKDIVYALAWAVARIFPLWLFYHVVLHIRDDRFVSGLILFSLIFGAVYSFILYLTNSWPALFWRYSSRLETRVINYKNDDLHQVKIFGAWYFISLDNGKASLSLKTAWTPTRFCESYGFERNFLRFINAHREEQNPNVKSTQAYVRGEKGKR